MEPRGSKRRRLTIAAIAAGATVLLVALAAGVVVATDQPAFCGTCHEMGPYHDAWKAGPHKDVACVSCHVGNGAVARVAHKFVALGEVRDHLFGEPTFPLVESPSVPDERCTACHKRIAESSDGFSHSAHAAKGSCQSCHPEAGHVVTAQALGKAGILNSSALSAHARVQVAASGRGVANLPGHKRVRCDRCHNMKATPCATCHEAKHQDSGVQKSATCVTCHQPGTQWVFAHPVSANCSSCHTAPKPHSALNCATCHKAGKTWAFVHPTSTTCLTCHKPPASHSKAACTTCHRTRTTWAFSHPSSSANCQECHQRPSGHRSGSCTTCHKTGTTWAFSHPGSSANCQGCHQRPSNHKAGSCTSCHSVGSRWVFRHPASSSCSRCHSSPGGHYGTTCASCHSPRRAWSNASFRHPHIRGGEHTFRSFACVRCHPNGYSSATCTHCHDSASGAGGGD